MPTPTPTPTPLAFDPSAAFTVVEYLATEVGPREAASAAFDEAVAYILSRFKALGGPAAATTSVPVPGPPLVGGAGRRGQVGNACIADPAGFSTWPGRTLSYRRAPGHRRRGTRRRGQRLRSRCHARVGADGGRRAARAPGADSSPSARRSREGGGRLHAPFRIAGLRPDLPVSNARPWSRWCRWTGSVCRLRRAAHDRWHRDDPGHGRPIGRRLRNGWDPVRAGSQDNRASDHWSFEKADIPSARVGSVPYPAYHSAADLPKVVEPAQSNRVLGPPRLDVATDPMTVAVASSWTRGFRRCGLVGGPVRR